MFKLNAGLVHHQIMRPAPKVSRIMCQPRPHWCRKAATPIPTRMSRNAPHHPSDSSPTRNDVGYLPDGTPMHSAGNAMNHPETIGPDPHSPGAPLPRANFVNDVAGPGVGGGGSWELSRCSFSESGEKGGMKWFSWRCGSFLEVEVV